MSRDRSLGVSYIGTLQAYFSGALFSLELDFYLCPDGVAALRQNLLQKILIHEAEELAKKRVFDSGERNICAR